MPRCISYSVVGSTQEVATRLAKEGAPHGTAVLAETQLLGRGREGSAWVSPKGGLYCSVVVRPEAPVYPLLSLAAALEVRHALVHHVPKGTISIRWPNDLMIAAKDDARPPRKFGGVLTDVLTRPGSPTLAVVGVGVNVDSRIDDFPPELQEQVAILREFRETPLPIAELGEPVRSAVLRACERLLLPSGRQDLPKALAEHLWGVGRKVTVEGRLGTFTGVGGEGEALVRLDEGGATRPVLPGELHLEAA